MVGWSLDVDGEILDSPDRSLHSDRVVVFELIVVDPEKNYII